MGFKQGRIVPGRDYNYSQAVYVEAGEAISKNDIVVIKSKSGGLGVAYQADCSTLAEARGRLMVAKHAIPSGERGVVLPWRMIDMDTSSGSVGDAVYLDTAGGISLSLDSTAKWMREVGTVVVADASGTVLLDPNMDPGFGTSDAAEGGLGAQTVLFKLTPAAGSTDSITLTRAIEVVNIWMVITTGGGTENLVVDDGTNAITTTATGTVSADDVVRCSDLVQAQVNRAAGDTLRAGFSGSTIEAVVYVQALLDTP